MYKEKDTRVSPCVVPDYFACLARIIAKMSSAFCAGFAAATGADAVAGSSSSQAGVSAFGVATGAAVVI